MFYQFCIIIAGGWRGHMRPIQRSSSYDPRISPGTPGDVPATPFHFLVNGNRLSQEPACRFFSCIRTFLRTSVLTGFNTRYGFRNLTYCRFRQMEQLHSARTKKEFIYIGFPAMSSNFRLSDFRGLFVHARCTPHQ